MEPLVSRYYAHLAPVQVHLHTASNKARYCELPPEPLTRPETEAPPNQPPPGNGKQGQSRPVQHTRLQILEGRGSEVLGFGFPI